jgi:hypothetical protein
MCPHWTGSGNDTQLKFRLPTYKNLPTTLIFHLKTLLPCSLHSNSALIWTTHSFALPFSRLPPFHHFCADMSSNLHFSAFYCSCSHVKFQCSPIAPLCHQVRVRPTPDDLPSQVIVAYWYVAIYFFSLVLEYDEVLNMVRVQLAPKSIQLVFKLTQLTTYRSSVNVFSSLS